MNKTLTVVVPTYNAEKYLRDNLESFCIDGIMDDIEVLVVNDGSTDASLDIALEYTTRYPGTFRVITKENGGHGSGINCGIQNAAGTYFKVVDADDWVEKTSFFRLLQVLKTSTSDIVYSGFYWVYDDGTSVKERFKKRAEYKEAFPGVSYQREYKFDQIADKLYVKMHNMTIRTAILKGNPVNIDEHCFYVDTEYITYPIPYVDTIRFVNAFVYMYRIGRRGQSVGLGKMQCNEKNYDRVLSSLLRFYTQLSADIPCTEQKKSYVAGIIARVVAGKIKIMLSFPVSLQKKSEIRMFDQRLKREYPDIYYRNINKAIYLLRKTCYVTYRPVAFLVKKYYR